jgi:hypothetical protein
MLEGSLHISEVGRAHCPSTVQLGSSPLSESFPAVWPGVLLCLQGTESGTQSHPCPSTQSSTHPSAWKFCTPCVSKLGLGWPFAASPMGQTSAPPKGCSVLPACLIHPLTPATLKPDLRCQPWLELPKVGLFTEGNFCFWACGHPGCWQVSVPLRALSRYTFCTSPGQSRGLSQAGPRAVCGSSREDH